MTAPDPLDVAIEHVAFLRQSGVPLVEAAAAIGATIGSDGWDGLTWAYARVWHELSQGVAASPENENARGAGTTPGILQATLEQERGHTLEITQPPQNYRYAPVYQAPRRHTSAHRGRFQRWRMP